MKHVFLSYAREDAEVMQRVSTTLKDEGISVWVDENLVPGTASWRTAIEQAIEAAGALVVLLSSDAKRSEWVNNEISYAQTQGVVIFPALLRGQDKDAVPVGLINTQRVDLRERFLVQMQCLVDNLREHLSRLELSDDSAPVSIDWMNRGAVFLRFWSQLKARSAGKTTLFANKQPPADYYWSASIGRSGFSLGYVISVKNDGYVNLYIDTGHRGHNKIVFDQLHAQKASIEVEFGAALEWERLDNKRASRIIFRFASIPLGKEDQWPFCQDQMIESMIRLEQAFREPVAKLEME